MVEYILSFLKDLLFYKEFKLWVGYGISFKEFDFKIYVFYFF